MAPPPTDTQTGPATMNIVPSGLYAGADIVLSRRASLSVQILGGPLMALLVALFPPTRAMGQDGWLVASGGVALAIAITIPLLWTRGLRSFDLCLAWAYVAAGNLALMQWLAGGWHAPFHEIFLGLLVLVGLVHPLRRAAPYTAFVIVLTLLPIGYGQTSGRGPEVAVAIGMWLLVVGFSSGVMGLLRAQRTQLLTTRDEAQGEARRDVLTGLGNRRSFDEAIAAAVQRRAAGGAVVAVAVGDVDRFKRINDLHGHPEGDRCLDRIADALVAASRSGDRVFRWGGDEFAVLLDGASGDEAAAACARLESEVANSVATPDGRPVTITFGWTQDDGALDAEALVAAADAALLERKRRRPRSVA